MNELFLRILNMSISASWLIAVVLLFRFAFKKTPKWINTVLWGIVALRLTFPFSIESALSLIPSAETIPLDIETTNSPEIYSGINAINSIVNPIINQFYTSNVGNGVNLLQIVISILAIIWIVVVAVLLARAIISYFLLYKKLSTAIPLQKRIYQSENINSPFVLGIINPGIYLPFDMGKQDINLVIAHEQAHIRRKDNWWKAIGFLLLTVHWFNPLIWLAYVLFCRDLEFSCDEAVIRDMTAEQRANYTEALLHCSVKGRSLGPAFGEIGVKARIRTVMSYKKAPICHIVLAFICGTFVAICFMTDPVMLPNEQTTTLPTDYNIQQDAPNLEKDYKDYEKFKSEAEALNEKISKLKKQAEELRKPE